MQNYALRPGRQAATVVPSDTRSLVASSFSSCRSGPRVSPRAHSLGILDGLSANPEVIRPGSGLVNGKF
jgi:hypothetical protein